MKLKQILASVLCSTVLLSPTAAFAGETVTNSDPAVIKLNLNLNGNVPNMQGILYEGKAWVPLRATADGLGIAVCWDEQERIVKIDDGTRGMHFQEGTNLYSSWCTIPDMVGMTAPVELAGAPKIDQNGRMWVPTEAFKVLVGYEISLNGNVLTIDKLEESVEEAEK